VRISRTTYSTLAAGFGPWIPVNYLQLNFNVSLAVLPSAAATGQQFSAQYTTDDQVIQRPVQWSQAVNTVTITDPLYQQTPGSTANPHGLVTADSIDFLGSGLAIPGVFTPFDGYYQVTVTSPTTYTITVTPSQTAAGNGFVIPQRVFTTTGIPTLSAARIITNLTQPCTAVRLAVAALTGGTLDFVVVQGVD